MAQKRTRNWDFVFYPESAPENWLEVLEDMRVQFAVSPLHDLDCNPTGEIKKAHFHAVLCFPSVKTQEQVKRVLEPLNCPIPIPCNSLKGSLEYFWHKNNPEKHQYDPHDLIIGGGLDIDNILKATATERYEIIAQMVDWCNTHDIIEYKDLLDYARQCQPDWFKILCDSGTIVMNRYIESNRNRLRDKDS